MYGNRARIGGGRSGQVDSADSYVLYSEGRAGQGCMYGIGWDLPVCIAYLVLCFDICSPLQEEGDCPKMAITGRPVEGCIPKLQQQQRDRDRSGQVRARKERNRRTGQGYCGTVRQEIGQGRVACSAAR